MFQTLNPREMDVLNILWKKGEEMMATDIVNESKDLTQSTVTAVLRKLLNENLVKVAGITHSGRVLSRTYRPTEASREIILKNFVDSYNCFSAIIPESEMCAALLTKEKPSQQTKTEIVKLMEMLDAYEKAL